MISPRAVGFDLRRVTTNAWINPGGFKNYFVPLTALTQIKSKLVMAIA
jgi:hypothetical protein